MFVQPLNFIRQRMFVQIGLLLQPINSIFLSHQTSTSHQPAVIFSHNKLAPATSLGDEHLELVNGAVMWFLLQLELVLSVVVLFAVKPHFRPCARIWCCYMWLCTYATICPCAGVCCMRPSLARQVNQSFIPIFLKLTEHQGFVSFP